jgi:hypothetical protein
MDANRIKVLAERNEAVHEAATITKPVSVVSIALEDDSFIEIDVDKLGDPVIDPAAERFVAAVKTAAAAYALDLSTALRQEVAA